jgi:signal transduction histidine kinase
VVEARLQIEAWQRVVDADLAQQGWLARSSTGDPAFSRAEFEQALDSSSALRDEIAGRIADHLSRLGAAERSGFLIQVAVGLLGLLSTGLVVWLGLGFRSALEHLRVLHREAMRANESRTRLLRGVTHDLKNPLGTADLYAQMLAGGAYGSLRPEQTDVVERIRASLRNVLELITDLLELARAESGNLDLQHASVDVGALVAGMKEDFCLQAAAADLSVLIDDGRLVHPVEGDPNRIREILQNLFGNAVKYTPPGGRIELHIHERMPGRSEDSLTLVGVDVMDTGPGIPPEQLDRVFEEFVRIPTSGKVDGAGLGLAISRHLARLMAGDITVESELARGSTFTLWLPAFGSPRPGTGSHRGTEGWGEAPPRGQRSTRAEGAAHADAA